MYNKKVLREATKNLNSTKAPAKKKDMIVDPMGQWKYPGQNTRIPGNDITMQGVPYPVWAVPNVGAPRMMYPEQDYYFPGADHVDEYPQVAKRGGDISIPKLNQYEDGGEYDLTQEEIDDLIAQGYIVEDADEYKKGGTPRALPKKKSSKAYSRSLTATNKLFAESPLTKKSKSKKNKIFDPNAKYYQDGGPINTTGPRAQDEMMEEYPINSSPKVYGNEPEDYSQFTNFNQTLPSNLQDPEYQYGNPDQYDLYGMWNTLGKPGSFKDVQDSDYFPLQDDGTYHGFSVGSDGTVLKPMSHSTTWKEVMNSSLNTDPYFKENRLIKNEQGRLQYVPNKQDGGISPLEGNYISKVIMNRNRGTDFVDRAYALGANPGTRMFNVPDDEEFGSYMSHKMATGEDDSGQTWMFPTVLNPKDEGIKVPNQYADYISSEGYKVATGMKQEGGFQDNIYTEYINKQPVTQSKRDMRISQKPNYHLEPMSITNPEKDRYWLTLSDRLKNLKSFIGGEDSTLKSGVSYQFQDGGTSLPGLEKVSDQTSGGLRVQQFAGQGSLDPKLQAIVDSWSQPKSVEYTPEKQCPEGYMYDYEKRDCVKIPKNSQLVDTQEEYDKLLKIYNEAKKRNDYARRYIKLQNEYLRRQGNDYQYPVFERKGNSILQTQIPRDLSKVRLVNKNGEWDLINFPEWSEDQETVGSYIEKAKKLGLTSTGRYSYITEGERLPEFKEVQPILKPGQITMKPIPAVPIDMELPKPELIPWTPPVVKKDRDVKVVLPETKEEWKTLPGTGTQYRVTRPVDPRFSREYNLRTGAYDNYAKGGFQDDINRRRNLLRDWTYGASIGMLHKAQEGKNIKTKFREAYPKGTIFTYKDNPDLINSTANFDMISNVEISPEYNEQIKQRLYTGNFGFDPNSGALVKLNKSQQKAIPQDIKDIRTKEKETAEEYKRQVKNENIKQQQELEYLGSMLEAGYDPGTFAGGFLPQKQEYKEYFDYGPRSREELQNVPVENWTKEELDNWAREGHMAVMHNPLFQTAAYFTPEGIAIGAIDAAANLLPDLYNRDYISAAFDASMVLPFLPKGTLKNIRQGIGKGYETGKELITPTISKEAATASSTPVKSGLGAMDMGMYEIKNPDYYTQLLNTYDNKMMPAANRKFYKDLINTVKKQNGLVTERQYMELKRLNTGNFNFGKKAYEEGGFTDEVDYEDLDLTPEEIDWYLANGYELEDLGESETFDDYIPEAQEGLVFKGKTNVIPVKETVAPVKKPAVQQPVKQEPVAPVRRELSPYEKIMAENMKRSIEFPDKKQITVQEKPLKKLPNKPKAKEEFAFPALNLGSGAPAPSLTRTPSNQPIAGGLGSQFTNVGRAGKIDYNKFAQQQKETKQSAAKSKTYKQIDASAPVRKGLLKEDKRLTDENFKNRAENEKQWAKRFLDKKGVIDVQDYKLDPKKTQNKKAPVVSSTPKPAKFYQELGTVPDSYSPKNKLLSYRNQWDNKEGFEYIATPVKKDRTGKEEYKNVKGVGHFLLDGSVAEGNTYKWKDNDAYINRAKKNNEWIPAFTRVKGDRVRLQYKKANELTKNDIVVSPLRQMRYDEIRFDKTQRPEGFKSGIKEVKKNDGQGTYLLFKDRNGYSRFSGGSVVFIFKDKYGNTIVRDYAGSLNGIENEGINIKKEYNLKPGELTIGYHDVGSFSAKPKADSTGVLRSSQWDGFNDNGVTGGALLIPNK